MLQCIVELAKRGVYLSVMIKKRRYWPRYVKAYNAIKHFEDKEEIGVYDALPRQLNVIPFHLVYMKEETM